MAFNSFGASQSSLGNQNVQLDSDEPEEVETEVGDEMWDEVC